MGLLSGVGVCALYFVDSPEVLHAGQPALDDRDHDGLRDVQELVIGCAPTMVDTDGDGYSDLEEFARKSSPTLAAEIPLDADVSAAMSARGEGGFLRIYMAIFQSPTSAGNVDIRVGTLANSRLLSLPYGFVMDHADISTVTTDNGVVKIVDMWVSPKTVGVGRNVSWFVYAFDRSDADKEAAAVVDIFNLDHVHTLRIPPNDRPGATYALQVDGSVYRPIPPSGTNPGAGWNPNAICSRSSQTVAVDGAIVTQEVTDAACVEDWDAYCSADACAASMGSTFQTIDPVVLVGN